MGHCGKTEAPEDTKDRYETLSGHTHELTAVVVKSVQDGAHQHSITNRKELMEPHTSPRNDVTYWRGGVS